MVRVQEAPFDPGADYHQYVDSWAKLSAMPITRFNRQQGDKVYIIEVNDNPSIESAVEDGYLENELYEVVMGEFRRRLDKR